MSKTSLTLEAAKQLDLPNFDWMDDLELLPRNEVKRALRTTEWSDPMADIEDEFEWIDDVVVWKD